MFKKLKQHARGIIALVLSKILPSGLMRDKAFFHLWEARGYHVTPAHFYEPVPDTRDFPPDLFKRESSLAGIEMNENGQLSLLADFVLKYQQEYGALGLKTSGQKDGFYFENGMFETIDAEVLYCIIRHFKPKRSIEIGSGFSTLIAAAAIRQNIIEDSKYCCELTCIEPYPKEWLGKISEVSKIIQSQVEKLPLELFKSLDENDILFIDSSHVVNPYNDVCFEYLDVLPILSKGVLVHIHDVVLPKRYFEYWHETKKFWNEQYLLQAFMTFNASFQVLWAGNFMHLKYPDKLNQAFPSYSRFKNSKDEKKQLQGHKSFWIQRVS